MGLYALIRNGMGDPDLGTGAEEDDLLYFSNHYLLQSGRIDSGDFLVSERAAGANMSVDVAKGRIFIDNSSYVVNTDGTTRFWAALNDAVVNKTISANVSGNPRIDIITVKMTTATAPDDEASNVISVEVVEGTPAGSPVAPATPSNSYKIAEIAVASGATSIVDANITDTRDYAYINLNKGTVAYNSGIHFLDSNGDPTNYLYVKTGDHPAYHIGIAAKSFLIEDSTGTNRFEVNTNTGYVAALDSYHLRAYSAGNDKYLDSFHDDTNGIVQSSSGSVYAKSTTGILGTISPSGAQSMRMGHNNTDGELVVSTGAIVVSAAPVYFATSIFGNGTNTYDLGSVATDWRDVYGQNAYTTVSDEREKELIEASPLGLNFIDALQTKRWKWKDGVSSVQVRDDDGNLVFNDNGEIVMEEVAQSHHRKHHGLIAQDIEQLLIDQGISTEDFGGFIKDEATGKYCLRYGEFMAPMIRAIQELNAKVDALA